MALGHVISSVLHIVGSQYTPWLTKEPLKYPDTVPNETLYFSRIIAPLSSMPILSKKLPPKTTRTSTSVCTIPSGTVSGVRCQCLGVNACLSRSSDALAKEKLGQRRSLVQMARLLISQTLELLSARGIRGAIKPLWKNDQVKYL